jgi:hypothetical protein
VKTALSTMPVKTDRNDARSCEIGFAGSNYRSGRARARWSLRTQWSLFVNGGIGKQARTSGLTHQATRLCCRQITSISFSNAILKATDGRARHWTENSVHGSIVITPTV